MDTSRIFVLICTSGAVEINYDMTLFSCSMKKNSSAHIVFVFQNLHMFVWGLSSHSRIVHPYGDVTAANFDLCSALMAIEQ